MSPSSALHRFLDMSLQGKHRRQMRLAMRRYRANQKGTVKKKDNRTGRRTKRLPCCAKERRYCTCFIGPQGPQHMFSDKALQKWADDIKQSEMLTAKDPKDMAFILPRLKGTRMSIHRFLFSSALFRMYSKRETYEALNPFCRYAVAHQRGPDWIGMENKLTQLYEDPSPVWGGMFYPATLIAAKDEEGEWKTFRHLTTAKQKANRDMHVFKAVWKALCRDDTASKYLLAHQRCSTTCWQTEAIEAGRQAFANWYDSFYDYMSANTRGWFSHYAMKCILDVGTNCSIHSTNNSPVFPDALLSKWPINCPAYSAALRSKFKSKFKKKTLRADLKFKCLMYVHAVLSKKLGGLGIHGVSSTLAHLCWQKRTKA